jgi:hypothetical protein
MLGAAGGGGRLLDVDRDIARQCQPHLRAPRQRAVPERAAQLREERAERRVGGRGRRLGPEHVDQLAARAGTVAVDRQVCEQEPSLAPWQPGGLLVPAGAHFQRPAQPEGPA